MSDYEKLSRDFCAHRAAETARFREMNAERAAWERATELYLAQLQPYWDTQAAEQDNSK